MFLGTYQTRFSGAGRVVLPKKLRGELKDAHEIVLTRGIDGGIWGFDKKDWEKEARRQLEIPITERKGRDLRRLLFSGAEVAELDKQGRFIIPSALLLQVGFKDKCLLIGAGDHFELWDPKLWDEILKMGEWSA